MQPLQLKGIPGKVGDLQNLLCLIAVGQDADILFCFEPQDFLLQMLYGQCTSLLCRCAV